MKRLRVFAGPNGSGKSVLYRYLISQQVFHPSVYINADEITEKLPTGYSVLNWSINISEEDFSKYLESSTFTNRIKLSEIQEYLRVKNSIISWEGKTEHLTYVSAAIADYLRYKMLDSDSSFIFETVLSHPSKLDFLKIARKKGFKIYFYFIATKDPLINIGRVEDRVIKGGHSVPPEKIKERYYKTMSNLLEAILLSDKAFIFDNSESTENETYRNFAEYDSNIGEIKYLADTLPDWFCKYVVEKNNTLTRQ